MDHFYVVSPSLDACNVPVTVPHGEVPKRLNICPFSLVRRRCNDDRHVVLDDRQVLRLRWSFWEDAFGADGTSLNGVDCRCRVREWHISQRQREQMVRWSSFLVCELGDNFKLWFGSQQRNKCHFWDKKLKKVLIKSAWCHKPIGGICFTKKWRAETLNWGSESENSTIVA